MSTPNTLESSTLLVTTALEGRGCGCDCSTLTQREPPLPRTMQAGVEDSGRVQDARQGA
jgi:hypothetical protein